MHHSWSQLDLVGELASQQPKEARVGCGRWGFLTHAWCGF